MSEQLSVPVSSNPERRVDAPVAAPAAHQQPGPHRLVHGFTRWGHPVYRRTIDHLPTKTGYQRFNKKLALLLTDHIGTMTCFWIFCVISFSSLLAVMYAAHIIGPVGFLTAQGFILMVSWISQNFIQLVLLPALMVGQNLQNEASDVRSTKQFEDTETIVDRLDTHTQGGITTLLDELRTLEAKLDALLAVVPGAQTD
jgi:hypothetical protein